MSGETMIGAELHRGKRKHEGENSLEFGNGRSKEEN
jgi:hypothetical protein